MRSARREPWLVAIYSERNTLLGHDMSQWPLLIMSLVKVLIVKVYKPSGYAKEKIIEKERIQVEQIDLLKKEMTYIDRLKWSVSL